MGSISEDSSVTEGNNLQVSEGMNIVSFSGDTNIRENIQEQYDTATVLISDEQNITNTSQNSTFSEYFAIG